MILILFYLVTSFVILMDQLSKHWIRSSLQVGETIEVWEGVLNFTHFQNSGAAFGWFEGYGRLFVPVAIIIAVLSVYMLKKGFIYGKLLEIGVALFVGGAIGNAIDRTIFNRVTDFIHFQFDDGILNLADFALVFGVFLLLVDSLIIDAIKKRREIYQK
ncbi:signal peptidase II [Oceanobacillus piezotolerans]|uniref:Lipoprotein signal peptidase n=1 Tax=Oceanobacillus piezotolerans TaxID=2448030 RepID=A0A498D138_9BACI|nr:signal peptidase II [Oceanobacillus piezotolerans]RLL39992.1 signal peptidase II [Oceanobacillus piezotolerans]